jgi:signal transduction histidine kinase
LGTRLIDNAVKFMPKGGRVELSLSHQGDEDIVHLRDTTPSIAVAKHDLSRADFTGPIKATPIQAWGLA